MRIVEITSYDGAHRNQTINGTLSTIPEGWAVIPDDMVCENFPFGEVKAEEIGGMMTVTRWVAGELPPVEEEMPSEPTTAEILDTLLGVNVNE